MDAGPRGHACNVTPPATLYRRGVLKLRIKNWKEHFENHESRKLNSLKWVAMPNRMNTQGYTSLVHHPNGAAHFGAWCAIVEICSTREPKELRGTLPESDGSIGGISRTLGRISRLSPAVFEELLPRLINDPEIAWIEQLAESPGENPDASGESPGTSGENPETSRREGRGGEGIGGNRREPDRSESPRAENVRGWKRPTMNLIRTTRCQCGKFYEGAERRRCDCGKVHDPKTAPEVEPMEETRRLLAGYVEQVGLPWGDPDEEMCRRTLEAAGGSLSTLVARLRFLLLDRRQRPKQSYAWFPAAVSSRRSA